MEVENALDLPRNSDRVWRRFRNRFLNVLDYLSVRNYYPGLSLMRRAFRKLDVNCFVSLPFLRSCS